MNLVLLAACAVAFVLVLKAGFKILKVAILVGMCWFAYQTFGILAVPALLLLMWGIKKSLKLLKFGMVIALIVLGLNYFGILSLIGISF